MISFFWLLTLLLFTPDKNEPAQKLWEKNLDADVLAVVNADSSRITTQEPGEESVSTLNMSIGQFGQGPFQVVDSARGVLLLAASDKSQFVQLVAVDVATGQKLWQLPCTTLPVADLPKAPTLRTLRIVGAFIATRNQVIVVQQPGAETPAATGPKVLISYDLRAGTELWRSQVGQDFMDMMKQMVPTFGNSKSWAMRRAMKQVENMMPTTALSLFALPQRNLLLKLSIDPTGPAIEALDFDTGLSAWVHHSPPFQADTSRLMKTRSVQDMKRRSREDPQQFSELAAKQTSKNMQGGFFFEGCSGPIAEASQGSGRCSNLRAYSITTGRLVWEYQEPPLDMLGYLATREVVLVRFPRKAVALRLSTGEKLYEIPESRAAAMDFGLLSRTYADGNSLFWFDRAGKSSKLTALDTGKGELLWEAPLPKDKVVSFLPREKALVVATESGIIVLDRASGKELLRLSPIGKGPIRAVSSLDSQSIVAVGDEQIVRYETDSWKPVYSTVVPSPKKSILGEILLVAVAAVAASLATEAQTSMRPSWMPPPTPALKSMILAENLNRMLASLPPPAIKRLEQRSSHYCYFSSGDLIHRVDVTTGKLEQVGSTSAKDSMFTIEESSGIGCLIRKRTLTAWQMPMDEQARRTARFSNGIETGYSDVLRGAKLESPNPAGAAAAYISAARGFTNALAAGEEVEEKAMANLALGGVYDRLAFLVPQESGAWKDKAIKEYTAAVNLTCSGSAKELQPLCQAARQSLEAKPRP